MARLLVHVEGQTEEDFVNEVLAPQLLNHGYTNVSARIVGNVRQRDHRGGIRGWDSVKKDIVRHLKEDRNAISTMMVDYYALPSSGNKAWPGRDHASSLPFPQKASFIEDALLNDIQSEMGDDFNSSRFIPNIIMHEFEGLLFSDCNAFANAIGCTHLAPKLQLIRDAFQSPEYINDSPQTAPSKRIQNLIPT